VFLLVSVIWLCGETQIAHVAAAVEHRTLNTAVSADVAQARDQRAAGIPFVGTAVDGDAPVIYRLPKVSLFVPVHVGVETSARPWTMLSPLPEAENRAKDPILGAAEELNPEPGSRRPRPSATADGARSQLTPASTRESIFDRRAAAQEPDGMETVRTPQEPPVQKSAPPPASEKSTVSIAVERGVAQPRPAERNPLPFGPPKQTSIPLKQTSNELTLQLLPAVQRGYGLAQRGALFAAQTEFVQVLRRIAQAKDVAAGCGERSQALAAGLRALDEAEDFVPAGIQLEADIEVQIVASSHRTPALQDGQDNILPHQAAELYHRYAEEQLAFAVSDEQAGSMALHGLGKIYALLAARNDDDMQWTRRAHTMYSAALVARPDNHLAANELGVILCRSGRTVAAIELFARTIDGAPSSLAYHNLAVAQRKLGLQVQAAANEHQSQRLAALERANGAVSQREGVTWVSSEEMARVAQPALLGPAISSAIPLNDPFSAHRASVPPQAPDKSPWQRTVDFARSMRGRQPQSNNRMHMATPFQSPAVPNQTHWW
jgi:hypothetical protein